MTKRAQKFVVWKYTITDRGNVALNMPVGAEIIHVASQNDCVTLWAQCDPDADTEPRRFKTVLTGEPVSLVSSNAVFVGTALLHDGKFVVHVYEAEPTA